jgi:hypothetical protein
MKIRMILVSALFALVAASGMAMTGCGGASCESLCEDGKTCAGAQANTDCAKSCADAEALNSAASCGGQYDDLVSCSSDKSDVCSTSECQTEGAAYAACVLDFCTKNPMAAECSAS